MSAPASAPRTECGERTVEEVVQIYLRDEVASVTRPVKAMRGFRRVMLAPRETRRVTFNLCPDDFSFLDRNLRRTIEPGSFIVSAGGSSSTALEAKFAIEA